MNITENDTVLVTGGTGSFGRAAVRRMLDDGCGRVRVFSRDETKQYEMRTEFADDRLDFHLGDVRNSNSVDHAMRGVDVVFHAAALKQVPSCEFFPLEAVQTNVIGTSNVIDSAIRNDARSVLCLSTDKAVMPINAMGMTKALMEKIVAAAARRDTSTLVACVRYGNVMFSRGSVLPLFLEQIQSGLPITVTDPEMTRFLLPLDQAIDLIDTALQRAEPGDTFVRRAPAARLRDMAEAIRQIFDFDVPIEIIGTRHGEKQYETLATRQELLHAEQFGEYIRIPIDTRGLDYMLYFSEGTVIESSVEEYRSDQANVMDFDAVVELLNSCAEIQSALATR
jgi:UDP-N-acetylglucosamine 4,6-dehydratase